MNNTPYLQLSLSPPARIFQPRFRKGSSHSLKSHSSIKTSKSSNKASSLLNMFPKMKQYQVQNKPLLERFQKALGSDNKLQSRLRKCKPMKVDEKKYKRKCYKKAIEGNQGLNKTGVVYVGDEMHQQIERLKAENDRLRQLLLDKDMQIYNRSRC